MQKEKKFRDQVDRLAEDICQQKDLTPCVKTQPANVDTVVIDRRILKDKGEFVAIDVEEVARRAAESFTAALRALAVPSSYTIRDLTSMLLTPGK